MNMKNIEILERRSFSTHPDDKHLHIVLAKRPYKYSPDGWEYVTWIHNLSDGAFYHGHYFHDKEEAERDFWERS